MKLHLQTGDAPCLRKCAKPIELWEDYNDSIDAMWDILDEENGIGLAGNQVNLLKRIIIVQMPGGPRWEFINPVITRQRGTQRSVEGCLSYPGVEVVRDRYKLITVTGLDRNGQWIRRKCRGLEAACFQHEIDHLNGRTIA